MERRRSTKRTPRVSDLVMELMAVDLMAPNLNRDKVQYKAQLEREAAKKASQAVKDRDKAALDKQRYVHLSSIAHLVVARCRMNIAYRQR